MSRIHTALLKQPGFDTPGESPETPAADRVRDGARIGLEEPELEEPETCRRISITPSGSVLPFGRDEACASEQYRLIRTRLLQHEKKPRLIAVSSPASGDGKTVSAINIAAALSLTKRVVLIDGDFRRSRVDATLGIEPCAGLAEVLSGRIDIGQAIVANQLFPQLYIVPAGVEKANAAELLQSANWPAVCQTLRRNFDYVVVDTPPIGAVADYELIQKEMDGIVFIVRPDHTKKTACNGALAIVPREKLLGAVVNCSTSWPLWRNPYGYSGYARYYGGGKAGGA